MDTGGLLDAPLDELMREAARLRDAAHGARVTYSPKVFIPLGPSTDATPGCAESAQLTSCEPL